LQNLTGFFFISNTQAAPAIRSKGLIQRGPRLFGQHVPVLKWRFAVFCLCGGAPCRQVVKVHSIRRVTVKRPMRPGLVIERQVAL
jgi:hypothetical protein